MAKQLNKLTAKTAESLATKGRHSDGGGLYLKVLEDGRRQWVFMFRWQGKPKEMGLGAFAPVEAPKGVKLDIVSLADARQKATDARAVLASGLNPIDARRNVVTVPTFGKLADELVDRMETDKKFRSAKHLAQWRTTLGDDYCKAIRNKGVDAITVDDIEALLTPIWNETRVTATRICGRIEHVLAVATVKKYRAGPNPAAWKGNMALLLPSTQKADKKRHKAMHYDDLPAFMAKLRAQPGMASLALEFAILTASRSGEVYGAVWSEFDLAAKLWTIPAARMKPGKEHTVPLCDRALEILEAAKALCLLPGNLLVFPGRKRGVPLSDKAMKRIVERMELGATVHGFRSTFRDWCGDKTESPREIAEAALSHAVGSAVEQAYRRGTALERRRHLMAAWEVYCGGDTP